MFAAPFSGTNPFGGVTARGPVPGAYLMKTSPETTRASNVLPGTGGSEPSDVSWSSGMPSPSRSPGVCCWLEPPGCPGCRRGWTTVKVVGALTPLMPGARWPAWPGRCTGPGASGAAAADHVLPERAAGSVCTGAPAASGPRRSATVTAPGAVAPCP